ncbi:OmpP1/FadL family transporter [Candidatus Proelusimicrobium excrementi]|uniref:OmpP1/FadL family transporter n=1 Tax=Candidatus Proelusimicrobium excrementi TaxID=3416222 RepID=UPI003C9C3E91|nr:outer membrane protein transport protein [Elusimicrobiaceae bacterium]
MNKLFRLAAFVAVSCFCATSTLGAGFGLYEFSARGNAMGGAVLAGDAEPASLALNPALITDLDGVQFQMGVTEITASAKVTYNQEGQSPDRVWWTLPTVYYTQQLFEDWYIGLGAFPRFGLSGHYPDRNWAGSSDVYDVDVQSYSIQPTVAFQATERFSVAAGAEIMYFKFSESTYKSGVDVSVEGDSWGLGAILAMAYKANEKVNLGASFRTRVKQSVDGTSKFSREMAVPGVAAFMNGSAHGDIMLPAQLAMGISYRPIDDLLIEFNWMNIFWSSFDDLSISFERAPGTGVSGVSSQKKEWKDAYRMGLGAEYKLSNVVKLRGSYIFDKTPTNNDYMDVLVPVSNRHLFGTGIGLNLGKGFILDASYTFLIGEGMSGTNLENGASVKYGQAFSHMAGLSLRYTL